MKPLSIAERNLVVRLRKLTALSRRAARLDPDRDREELAALAERMEELSAKIDDYVGSTSSRAVTRVLRKVVVAR